MQGGGTFSWKKKLLLSKNKNKFTSFYYEFIKSSKKGCWYKKCNQDNNLIIPAGCVLYVGIDLATEKDSYLLQIEDHQDIMRAIAAS